MPLPPHVDTMIRKRFEDLLVESKQLLQQMEAEDRAERQRDRHLNIIVLGEQDVAEIEFYSVRTKVLSLLEMLSTRNSHFEHLSGEIKELKSTISSEKKLIGIVSGLQNDYEAGMLNDLTTLIEGNIAGDYLGQAEQLLVEGQPGKFDHVPAAVLTGSILEDALRRLCQRQTPVIPTEKPDGEHKKLNVLIDELKKVDVFNEIKAKQLRAWAGIRNAAAHGEFTEFTRTDVEDMLKGVKQFLGEYL